MVLKSKGSSITNKAEGGAANPRQKRSNKMIYPVKRFRINEEQYGVWYYQRIVDDTEFDAPIYNLYDSNGDFVNEFGSIGDMRHYCKTGEYL